MISDTLSDAVSEIDKYLSAPFTVYECLLRARIIGLRDQMDAIRRELDTPPPADTRRPFGGTA